MFEQLSVRTPSHSCLVEITSLVRQQVAQTGIDQGLCVLYIPHTTAGLTINENADPTVQEDILAGLDKLVPWRDNYSHAEGNSAAHIKASLLGMSLTLFVRRGELALGTWQGIYLAEFDGPRTRRVWVKVIAG
jgi:secondary thiamine-phosphate synthase enzyme